MEEFYHFQTNEINAYFRKDLSDADKYLVVLEIEPPDIPTVPVEALVPVAFIYFVVVDTAEPPLTDST